MDTSIGCKIRRLAAQYEKLCKLAEKDPSFIDTRDLTKRELERQETRLWWLVAPLRIGVEVPR